MTKQEIRDKIDNCQNDEELMIILKKRINELEYESQEKTVGQAFTTLFSDYISSKTHYKATAPIKNNPSPNLVYDDYEPYLNLFKKIQSMDKYIGKQITEDFMLFAPIRNVIYDYLGTKTPDTMERHMIYFNAYYHNIESISIKKFKNKNCGFCSEISGMAHNMFKILNINSTVVIGTRNGKPHAYNLIFPNGYENMPAVLVDFSFPVKCKSDKTDKVFDLPYYKVLNNELYNDLMNGKNVEIDATNNINFLLEFYKALGYVYQDSKVDVEAVTYQAGQTIVKNKTK